ncbi:MAG: sialate O-acetylesterase [Planctomycetaceae bacterium]
MSRTPESSIRCRVNSVFAGGLLALLLLNEAAAEPRPLKVFILAGQSNMEGHATVDVMDYLADDPVTAPLLARMKNPDGTHRLIRNTWISFLTGTQGRIDADNREVFGQLTTGYGSQGGRDYSQPGRKIGPELAFGITLQDSLNEPILIIKTAWGGQSLHTDFRSPSSGPFVPTQEQLEKRFATDEQKRELTERTGRRYRQMVAHVQHVLKDIKRIYPDYDTQQGYELSGFVWFQGFNDLVDRGVYPNREHPGGYRQYTACLINLIRDIRQDLDAPNMPFVIGVMGVGGPVDMVPERSRAAHQEFRLAMARPAELPEFHGNVIAVQTAPFWDVALGEIDTRREQMRSKAHSLRTKNPQHENADGTMSADDIQNFMTRFEQQLFNETERALETRAKSNAGYHYLGSAKTYSQIGQAFANALLTLLNDSEARDRP